MVSVINCSLESNSRKRFCLVFLDTIQEQVANSSGEIPCQLFFICVVILVIVWWCLLATKEDSGNGGEDEMEAREQQLFWALNVQQLRRQEQRLADVFFIDIPSGPAGSRVASVDLSENDLHAQITLASQVNLPQFETIPKDLPPAYEECFPRCPSYDDVVKTLNNSM